MTSMQNWLLTRHAVRFELNRPLPSMVCIEDIAHHLALINRFTGATVRPYSVAEHSLLVAEILERANVTNPMALRAALLHDAHEAITGDIASPLKCYLGNSYRIVEQGVVYAIEQHFGIAKAARQHAIVIKHADLVALATERRDLMPQHEAEWDILRGIEPVDWIDLNDRDGLAWTDWRLAFLVRHAELAAQCDASGDLP